MSYMISFLQGTIEHIDEKGLILNTGGIGYRVHLVPKLLSSISKNKEVVKGSTSSPQVAMKLFIHSQMNLREGTFDMYGFDKKQDLDLFNMIISVSGIGPKGALNILSAVEPDHLKAAVMQDDVESLRKISGLGPKTAQRLILELKNKIDYLDVGGNGALTLGQESQAIEALTSLGYNQFQAKDVLKAIPAKFTTLQDRVREALKLLGKK